ncbi:MAG: DUF3343 domain-containing protein [Bacillota bacterium]
MSEEYGLITFPTTHYALKTEKLLLEQDYQVGMRPIPPSISVDCGYGVEFPLKFYSKISEFLQKTSVQTTGYYHIINKDNKKRIIKL